MFDFKKKTPKIFTTYKPRFVRIKVILKLFRVLSVRIKVAVPHMAHFT